MAASVVSVIHKDKSHGEFLPFIQSLSMVLQLAIDLLYGF
jgi:hypothetical protein